MRILMTYEVFIFEGLNPKAEKKMADLSFYDQVPDLLDKTIAFESGDMEPEEVVDFFQNLVDTGICWKLQGAYGRQAHWMIENGLVDA